MNNHSDKELIDTVSRLISSLELLTGGGKHPIETQALGHLKSLFNAIENHRDSHINRCVSVLNHFWLESVAWCSQLSRDIEKVLILCEESRDRSGPPSQKN